MTPSDLMVRRNDQVGNSAFSPLPLNRIKGGAKPHIKAGLEKLSRELEDSISVIFESGIDRDVKETGGTTEGS